MQDNTKRFFRADGSIDMERALRAGRAERAEALRHGVNEMKRVFVGEPRVRRRLFW